MFEKIRYAWNVTNFRRMTGIAGERAGQEQFEVARVLYEQAVRYGEKALKFQERVKNEKIEGLQGIVEHAKQMVEMMDQAAVVRDMKVMSLTFRIKGANPQNYLADKMIDMYRIVADRLDSPEVLKKIYLENEAVPLELRATINQYMLGKLTRKQIEARLQELKAKTERVFRSMGIDPAKNNNPKFIYETFPEGYKKEKLN